MSLYGGGSVVDSKVVELTMENGKFESNAEQSLKTIEKLNKSLALVGDTKGIDSLNSSLKNVSFDALNNGIETTRRGFSLLETVTFGFFSTFGAKMEQTAASFAKLITGIDPLIDGFKEYELKMDSVQTILMGAKTAEGLPVTLDMVNQKLEELNAYSDKTIYSFRDMTSNIGKFTNAGVDLDTAVAAIQGISNEAALAGANANEASRAMYNFSQALSSGAVKLIDWKSIENANMATVEFKQTLIDTALELGMVKEAGDGLYEGLGAGQNADAFNATVGFNNALANQWMTSEVLTTALAKYADETTDLGRRAFEAATKVKTFSQLMDTLREAAGSGWAQTFEILIGDFEEARTFFTYLSNEIGGIIGGMAEERNSFLKAALGAPPKIIDRAAWEGLDLSAREADALYTALMHVAEANGYAFDFNSIEGFKQSLEEGWLTADMLKEALGQVGEAGENASGGIEKIQEAALAVIRGDYGNDMEERFRQLEEAGLDPQLVQDYVNTLHDLAGGTWNVTDAMLEQANAQYEAQAGLSDLSDEELKAMGYTESQIEILRSLAKELENSGSALSKATAESDELSNRTKIILALQGIITNLINLGGIVREVFESIFPPMSIDAVGRFADGFVNLAASFNNFIGDARKEGSDVRGILSGIFAILKFGLDLIGRVGGIVLWVAGKVLGFLVPILLKVFGVAGHIITFVLQMIDYLDPLGFAVEVLGGAFTSAWKALKDFFGGLNLVQRVERAFRWFKLGGQLIKDNFTGHIDKAKEKWNTFVENFKKNGGIKTAFSSWENFTTVVDDFKNNVLDYFLKFPGFGYIANAFRMLKNAAVDALRNIGVPVDLLSMGFSDIGTAVNGAKSKVKTFFTQVGQSEKLKKTSSAFKDAGKAIITGFVPHLREVGTRWHLFAETLKENGGFKVAFSSFDKIKETFGNLKSTVFDYLLQFPGFEKLKTAFTTLGTSIRQELIERGFPVEPIEGFFGTIWSKITGVGSKIREFFKNFTENEKIQADLEKIKGGFRLLWASLAPFWSNLKTAWGEFTDRVKELGGVSLDNLGDIWTAFTETIGAEFTEFKGFDGLKKAFGDIWTDIKAQLKESTGIDIDGIKQAFDDTIATISSSLQNFSLPEAFQSVIDFITGKLGFGKEDESVNVAQKIEDAGGAIEDAGGKINSFGQTIIDFFTNLGAAIKDFDPLTSLKELFFGMEVHAAEGDDFDPTGGAYAAILGGDGSAGGNTAVSAAETVSTEVGSFLDSVKANVESFITWCGEHSGSVSAAIQNVLFGLSIHNLSKLFGGLGEAAEGLGDLGRAKKWRAIGRALLAFAFALGVIVAAIWAITKLAEGPNFWLAIEVVAGIATAITIITIVLSSLNPAALGRAAATLFAFAIAVGVIGGVIYALATLPNPEQVLPIAEGLGLVIAAMGAAMLMIGAGTALGGGMALVSALLMVAVVALVAVIIAKLTELKNVDKVIPIADALGTLMLKLGVAMLIISAAGALATVGAAGFAAITGIIGTIAAIAVIIGIVEEIAPGLSGFIDGALDNAIKIMGKIGELFGALVGGAIGGFMSAAAAGSEEFFAALPGMAQSLSDFMANLQGVNGTAVDVTSLVECLGSVGALAVDGVFASISQALGGYGTFFDDLPGFATNLVGFMTNIKGLEEVGSVKVWPLTQALGAIENIAWTDLIASVAEAIGGEGNTFFDDLADIATNVVTFMTNLKGLEDVGTIDTKPLSQAIDTVSAIAWTDLVAAFAKFISGGENSTFFAELPGVGIGILMFMRTMKRLESVGTVDMGPLTDAINAVNEIAWAELWNSVSGLITRSATGKSNMEAFSSDLEGMANAIGTWQEKMDALGGDGDVIIDSSGITKLADAIKEISFAEISSAIASIFTEDDESAVEKFAEDVGYLGQGLITAHDVFDNLPALTFDSAGVEELVQAINAIPNTGLLSTIAGVFTGETDFTGFEEDITKLAHALNVYSTELGDLDTAKVQAASDGAGSVAGVLQSLANYSERYVLNGGAYTLTTFGEELVTFGTRVKEYAEAVGNVTMANMAASAAESIAVAADTISTLKLDESDFTNDTLVEQFKKNVDKLVEMFTTLETTQYSGVDRLQEAVTKLNETKLDNESPTEGPEITVKANTKDSQEAGNEAAKAATEGFKKQASAMSDAGTGAANAAAEAIKGSANQFTNAGIWLMSNLALGMLNNYSAVTSAGSGAASAASDAAKNAAGGVYEAGANWARGYANGITEWTFFIKAAAAQAVRQAIQRAKEVADEHSPSKETYKLGAWFAQGYGNGISENAKYAVDASEDLVNEARDGLSNAVNVINAMVSDDLDMSPTITPVLDLSEIQNGAGGIGDILNGSSMVNMSGSLRAIGASAARRTTNSDILSALTSLRGSVDSRPAGDTYVVNGVTYDDGSNVSNAVASLVRAVRMERRA